MAEVRSCLSDLDTGFGRERAEEAREERAARAPDVLLLARHTQRALPDADVAGVEALEGLDVEPAAVGISQQRLDFLDVVRELGVVSPDVHVARSARVAQTFF